MSNLSIWTEKSIKIYININENILYRNLFVSNVTYSHDDIPQLESVTILVIACSSV